MPVVATPATPIIVSVDQVRRFLSDRADKNLLLDDVQFDDNDVNQALEMVTSAYNAVTPQTMLSVQSWPSHLQYLLLLGVAWYLMKSHAFLQVRNQATYQAGDIQPIGIDDKGLIYSQFAQTLQQEWNALVRDVKTENNMNSAYGSLSSGYRNVSRYQNK